MPEPRVVVTPVDGGGPPPPPIGMRDVTRNIARDKAFDDVAAELAKIDSPDGAAEPEGEETAAPASDAAKPKSDKPKAKPKKPEPEETDDEAPDESEEGEDHEEGEEDAPDTKPSAKKPVDRDLDRRLAAVRKEQQRASAALAAQRQAFQDELRALQPDLQELRAFRQLKERARLDPASALAALGLQDADWEPAAKAIFARSPKARTDPRYADEAARALQAREHGDALAQANQRIAELEARIDQGQSRTMIEEYMSELMAASTEEAPLVGRLMANDRKAARRALLRKADELAGLGDGERPDYEDVIAALEDDERAELARRGIDWEAVVASPLKTKPKSKTMPPAAKTKSAKTPQTPNGANAAGTTPKGRDQTREEGWEDVVRALRSGKLDD